MAQLLAHPALSLFSTRASPTSTAPLSITTRYNNFNLSISQLYIFSMTRTGATLTMESGGTATATAKEGFPDASRPMINILLWTISLAPIVRWRHLQKLARPDVRLIPSVVTSRSGQRNFQTTTVALCLDLMLSLDIRGPQTTSSQGLQLVQVKSRFYFYEPHKKPGNQFKSMQ